MTTKCSKDSTHSLRYVPYQGPKPNRPQSNPGLLHSHTQLFCRSWRIIHVANMNSASGPRCVLWGLLDGQSMISTSWSSRKSLIAWAVWCGALSWTRTKLFWKLALAQGKRLFWSTRLYTCWFMVPSSTTSSLFHYSEVQPIRWQMDQHYHLFPAHRH